MNLIELPKGIDELKNGRLRLRVTHNGRTHTLSTKLLWSDNIHRAEAIKQLMDFRGRIYGNRLETRDHNSPRWEDALDVYLSKMDVGQITGNKYLPMLNNFWTPHFHHMYLTDITTVMIENILAAARHYSTGARLSVSRQKNLKSALSQVFVKNKMNPNPCDTVEIFTNKAQREGQARDPSKLYDDDGRLYPDVIYSYKERDALLDQLEGDCRLYYALQFGCGLRPSGECLGLQWEDFHLKDKTPYLHLQRQMAENGVIVHRLKSETDRIVYLPPWVIGEIERASKAHPKFRKGFIFKDEKGSPLRKPQTFIRRWKQAHEAVGLQYRDSYVCRHFRASELLSNGADTVRSAAQLGHSVQTHMAVYAKLRDNLAPEDAYAAYMVDYA